ncbi:replication protein [Bacillus sp. FJAT-44742]|uniref:replication protein n=1 Tax=Bacillus sp. FJAT-44742 TaxID=2014005 RepID=UPI000C23E8F8|nr:replication protein [Bacillus sp. FJAT-44742]
MTKVQQKNSYTKIANEILEEMGKIKLSPTQYRVLFIIWRFTYGFHRNEHDLSLSFLSQATGCDSRQIQRELKRLEGRRVIFQKIKPGSYRKVSFNKNHDEWVGKTVIGKTEKGEITSGVSNNGASGQSVDKSYGEIDKEERNKKKFKEKDHLPEKPVPFLEYEKFFGTPPSILAENFTYWVEKSQFQEPEEIICETIKRAKLQTPKKPAAYIESILKNIHNLELYTLAAVKEYNAKFDSKVKNKKSEDIPALNNMFLGSMNKQPTRQEIEEINALEKEFPF